MRCPNCHSVSRTGDKACRQCGTPLPLDTAAIPPLAITQPYRPSGRCPARTAILLAAAAFAFSSVAGWLYYLAARQVDLFIVMPLAAGSAVGWALADVIRTGKCRSTTLAVTLGLLVGPLTYGTRLLMESRQARPVTRIAVAGHALERGLRPSQARALAAGLSPWQEFRTYLGMRAETGARLRPTARAGLAVKGSLYWGLTLLEILLIGAVAAARARAASAAPFCEKCGHWCRRRVVVRANPSQRTAILEMTRAQEWMRTRFLPAGGAAGPRHHCTLSAVQCPECHATSVAVMCSRGKGEDILLHAALARESAEYLDQALERRDA